MHPSPSPALAIFFDPPFGTTLTLHEQELFHVPQGTFSKASWDHLQITRARTPD
jgi:hypothetical protein